MNPESPPRSLLDPTLVAVALLASVATLLGLFWPRATHDDPQAWRDVAAAISRGKKPGDAVLISPSWLPSFSLSASLDLPLWIKGHPGEGPLVPYRRLWMVRPPDRPLDDALVTKGFLPGKEDLLGAILVQPFEAPEGVSFGYDFLAHLSQAKVRLVWPQKEQPCDVFSQGRWNCPINPWVNVGQTTIKVGGSDQTCIWAHPSAGARLVTEFLQVPLGKTIQGRFAVSDLVLKDKDRPPISFTVLVDGQKAGEFTHIRRRGWTPFTTPTQVEPGSIHAVSFEVSTPREARQHFCFQASTQD